MNSVEHIVENLEYETESVKNVHDEIENREEDEDLVEIDIEDVQSEI